MRFRASLNSDSLSFKNWKRASKSLSKAGYTTRVTLLVISSYAINRRKETKISGSRSRYLKQIELKIIIANTFKLSTK